MQFKTQLLEFCRAAVRRLCQLTICFSIYSRRWLQTPPQTQARNHCWTPIYRYINQYEYQNWLYKI